MGYSVVEKHDRLLNGKAEFESQYPGHQKKPFDESFSGFEVLHKRFGSALQGLTDEKINALSDREVAETIEKLYEEKRAAGLVDVKFTLTAQGKHESAASEVLRDILRLELAIAQGHTTPIDFGDLRWKD